MICGDCGKENSWLTIECDCQKSRKNKLDHFVKTHCQGSAYDSCKNSPCPWSSAGGCTHPQHPENKGPGE